MGLFFRILGPVFQIWLHSEEIKGVNEYKIVLDKALVEDRIIKVNFISDDKLIQRDHYVGVSKTSNKVSAILNAENTATAKILEKQLEVELARKEIVLDDELLKRYDTLLDAKVDDQLNMLGADNKAAIMTLLADIKYQDIVIELLSVHRLAVEKNNAEEMSNFVSKILSISIETKVINDGL